MLSLSAVAEVFTRNRREGIPQWKVAGSQKIIQKGAVRQNDENLKRHWVQMLMAWVIYSL